LQADDFGILSPRLTLREKMPGAAGQHHQQHKSSARTPTITQYPQHEADNAKMTVKGLSTCRRRYPLSLPKRDLELLIGIAVCAHIAHRDREGIMDWRVRALTAALMTIVMVALVTLIATWLAVGFDPHFLRQWAKAFAVAWPVAATTAFFVMPAARALAERIVSWAA
jgi:hypothetical protein